MNPSRRQSGFSLLELLIAMMIIAVIATLGVKQYTKYSARARHLKAADNLKIVSEGLDQYYLKHGKYPDFGSFESMIEPNSALVKESLIAPNMPAKDPWGQSYQGKSSKGTYELKCDGDPTNPEELGPFTREPGKVSGSSQGELGGTAPAEGTK
jgi:prepilin-type N-terminal cleavage/methylation domain-containing protein